MMTTADSDAGGASQPVPMRNKNIILCSDGTGNRGGIGKGTNVWRLFQAVDRHGHLQQGADEQGDDAPCEQITFYDDGVGTSDYKLLKLLGGGMGFGLSRNIRDIYSFLVKHYQTGDRIYLFGFSRGAFTARCVAGLIDTCGIIEPGADDDELKRRVSETFAAYKFSYWQELSGMDRLASLADDKLRQVGIKYRRTWRCQTNHGEDGREAPVHCVGVWDTVGAVGMPVDELRDGLTWLLQQLARIRFLSKYVPVVEFLDGTPPRHMQHGFHALAIDDQRQAFHPTLWKESGNPAEGAQVEQVWFAGMHSNVGGGYPKDQLALVSLDWMMDRVEACGVRFLESSRAAVRQQLDEHGRMYDSRAGLGIYYRFMPRDLTKLWSDATKSDATKSDATKSGATKSGATKSGAAGPMLIHQSVMQRISAATQGYAPHNLSSSFNLVSRTALNPPVYQQQPWQVDAGKCDYYDACLARSAHYASWRRIIYMLLVGATLIFLGLITMLDPIPQGEMIEASPLLGGVISLLQFLLPDMLGGRLEALGAYEAPF